MLQQDITANTCRSTHVHIHMHVTAARCSRTHCVWLSTSLDSKKVPYQEQRTTNLPPPSLLYSWTSIIRPPLGGGPWRSVQIKKMSMCTHYMYLMSKVIENYDLSCPSRTSTCIHIHHTSHTNITSMMFQYMYTREWCCTTPWCTRTTAHVQHVCGITWAIAGSICVFWKKKKLSLLQAFRIIECSDSRCSDNRCSTVLLNTLTIIMMKVEANVCNTTLE